jgi:hypothetical protein
VKNVMEFEEISSPSAFGDNVNVAAAYGAGVATAYSSD